jgi:hypothetical protein
VGAVQDAEEGRCFLECSLLAILRAADKSRVAVERDEEGMGRSQPPSCREGLSWLSAVIVEKGPTIDQPAFGPPVPHFAHTCLGLSLTLRPCLNPLT